MRPGELSATCAECRNLPNFCECEPWEQDSARFERFDLAALAETGVPPPVLICGDLLYTAGLHSLAGPPDCGKSTLGYMWTLQLIRAGERVIIFDEESGAEQVVEKMTALGAKPPDLENVYYYQFPGRTWNNEDVAALADTLMIEPRPALVMWDSSAAFLARAGLDENAAADVTRFWSRVLTPCARRAGIAVLIIDHDVKNGEASRYARGSGAKLAATDVAYKLDALKPFTRTQDGILKLTVTKDRRGWLHRYHRIRVEHGDVLNFHISEAAEDEGDEKETDLPPAQAKLLDAMDDAPATVVELVDRIVNRHGHGLKRETVSRSLNELLKAGLTDRIDQGPGKAALWTRIASLDP
ncbi:MAG: AAA family ATPase [Streptosporangiaceae bacterium]